MATSKNPAFPHPPLEIGVPQYPTPVIPSFIDRDGHIVLVEKVSSEKGSYTPQKPAITDVNPVIYKGRDAKKWPETLYLVHERPSPEGEFVYRYWANDRSLASQDPWNYGISYSSENPAFPIYTRQYIVPRSQYTPIELGGIDPVFGGNAIVAKQQTQELGEDNPLRSRYIMVQRVYETIPGPTLTGNTINQRGDLETIVSQVVVAGTSPAPDGLLVTGTSVDAIDSVKSNKKYSSVTSYATLTSKDEKSGLLGSTYSTDIIVDPATNPDALSESVIASSVQAISATKSKKSTTTSTGPIQLNTYEEKSGLLGYSTLSERIVSYGSPADGLSLNVISSKVEAIDLSKAKKITSTSSGPFSLSGGETKAGLLGTIRLEDSIVAAGTAPDALTGPSTLNPTLTQFVVQSSVTPIDNAKSKRTTTIASGPTLLTGTKLNDRGDVETINESIVDVITQPDTLSYLLLSSEVTPIDSAKAQKKDVLVNRYSTLLGHAEVMGGGFSNAYGGVVNVENKIIDPANDTITGSAGFGTLSIEQKSINPKKTEVTIRKIDDSLGFPEIHKNNIDPTANHAFSSKIQVVEYSSLDGASVAGGLITEFSQLDKYHSEKQVIDYTPLVGVTWNETEMINYTFPGLVKRSEIFNPDGAYVLSTWSSVDTENYRISRSYNVLARVQYYITDSYQSMSVVNYQTVTIHSDLSQTFSNVLHNFTSMRVSNPVYAPPPPTIDKYINIPAPPSYPSVENYHVGVEILIRFSSERMAGKGGLYLNKATYITTQ